MRITDKIGATLALTCMLHCAAIPILALFLPFVFKENHAVFVGFWVVSLVINVKSLIDIRAFRNNKKSLWLSALAWVYVLVGLVWDVPHHYLIPASLLLAMSHIFNLRCKDQQ